ncbi:hypothetical protein DOY81_014881 [Sarcophaga bullata]|nr:hypothetical protein DOY81_014881 [Sarcophaga bullata]
MDKKPIKWLILGGALRFYLASSEWGTIFQNRVEIATPLNSFKRVQEGIYLLKQGTNPYDGDIVHEIPLMLWFLLYRTFAFILLPGFLYKTSKIFVRKKLQQQTREVKLYAKDTEELQFQREDEIDIPFLVLMAYLFNPLAIFNCAGLTCTVFSNLFLALALYGLVDFRVLIFFICIAIEFQRNLYPIVLLLLWY